MLFTCTPPGARTPGRFPGPSHARGKWFTLDIHCHVRSDKAAALVEGREEVSRWFLETQASPRSQAVNRANGVRTRAQALAEQRIADMDLMGSHPHCRPRRARPITAPIRQASHRAHPQQRDRRDAAASRPIVGLGTVPFQAPSSRSPNSTGCTIIGLPRHRIMTQSPARICPSALCKISRVARNWVPIFIIPIGSRGWRFKDHYLAT
jgi:hypothetical protein